MVTVSPRARRGKSVHMEDKLAAIYALRDAAERHGKVEAALGSKPTRQQRDALLDARIELEERTQQALESCMHCGRIHADGDPDCAPPRDRIIPVDFQRRTRQTGSGDEEEPPSD